MNVINYLRGRGVFFNPFRAVKNFQTPDLEIKKCKIEEE